MSAEPGRVAALGPQVRGVAAAAAATATMLATISCRYGDSCRNVAAGRCRYSHGDGGGGGVGGDFARSNSSQLREENAELKLRVEQLLKHESDAEEKARVDKLQTFYHGTALEAGLAIQNGGFNVDLSGTNAGQMLGPGVYLTTELEKATVYATGDSGRPHTLNPHGGCVLHLKVDLGSCKKLTHHARDASGRAMRKHWHLPENGGHDSVFSHGCRCGPATSQHPHGSPTCRFGWDRCSTANGIREEHCVHDAARVVVVDVTLVRTGEANRAGFTVQASKLTFVDPLEAAEAARKQELAAEVLAAEVLAAEVLASEVLAAEVLASEVLASEVLAAAAEAAEAAAAKAAAEKVTETVRTREELIAACAAGGEVVLVDPVVEMMVKSNTANVMASLMDCTELLPVNSELRLTMYYDMCPKLLNMAKERQSAQDWQHAFVVWFRLFNLIQYTIPGHNAFDSKPYEKDKHKWCREQFKEKLMGILEAIKPHIRYAPARRCRRCCCCVDCD